MKWQYVMHFKVNLISSNDFLAKIQNIKIQKAWTKVRFALDG